MRKVVLVGFMILILSVSLYAVAPLEKQAQNIAGFIGHHLDWGVSAFTYEEANSGKGLDLDINAPENSIRFQIAPTQIPKTSPGLKIGYFWFYSSLPNYSLIITPGYLVKDPDPNYTGPAVNIRYELAVRFLGDFNQEDEELDRRFGHLVAASGESIVISWSQGSNGGAVLVSDAGMYFRLSEEVSVPGKYSSIVQFTLVSDT